MLVSTTKNVEIRGSLGPVSCRANLDSISRSPLKKQRIWEKVKG